MQYRLAAAQMFVSRLELLGFKSFAQRTVLLFPEGLTAIVGPNGCGKSNIVDALRWVLGEQRVSVLRCETLDQLIFNGSRAAKPSGMAEVTLTVENTAGILPVEFSQVVVTRRIYRSGESEYRLNGTPCRLRDIQELFLDTGFAAHSYSVIELRMVEELLNGRPEERRRLLEEAAGIGKYKLRRREAQRKLELLRHDIEHIEALLAELRQHEATLREHAEHARQWQQWNEQRQSAERLLLALRWRRVSEQLHDTEQELRRRREQLDHIGRQAEQLHAQLHRQQAAQTELEEALNELAEQQNRLTTELHPVRLHCEMLQERLRIAQDSRQRLLRERDRIEHELERFRQQLEEGQRALQEAHQQWQQWQNSLSQIQQRREELRQALQQCQRSLQPQRQRAEQHRQQLFALQVELERIRARRELVLRQLQHSRQEYERLRHRYEELQTTLAQHEEELRTWQHQCDLQHQHLQHCEARATELNEQLQQLHQHGEEIQRELLALSARSEWLKSLVSEHAVLASLQAALPDLELSVLVEHARVPEWLQRAFAALIAGLEDVVVVHGSADYADSIRARLIESAPAGAVLFPSAPEPAELPSVERDGVRGWLWQMVDLPPALAAALRLLLGRVLVVDSLAIGEGLLQEGIADAVVTLHGVVLHRSGLLRWRTTQTTPWIGRRHALEELERRLSVLYSERERNDAALAQLRQQLQELNLEQVRRAYNEAEHRVQHLCMQWEQLQQHAERIARTLEELRDQIRRMEAEDRQLQQREHQLADELQRAQETLRAVEAQLRESGAEEERLRMALESVAEEWRQAERQSLAAQHACRERERMLKELEQRIEQLHHRRAQLQRDSAELDAHMARLQEELQTAQERRREHESRLEELSQRREHVRQRVKQCREIAAELAEELRSLQQQREAELQHLHATELRSEQLRTQRHELAERFRELFGEDPSEVSLPEPAPSAGRLQQQLRQAIQQLDALGPVNFRAVQEYEQLAERLQLMESHYADLQQAALSLQQIVEETHRIAVERFTETFEQVRRNFQRLFQLLFQEGDEADLRLGPGDPLEASIDIIAKPRGKRPQVLEQLSGGEKTLVAIAFLFAIYLIKPSPFCVLDEIDAPLDDSNIERFLRLLRSFADSTQFLLITHNKRTMEAVDTLYGVTMQPEGVSKVVAVRLRSPEHVVP